MEDYREFPLKGGRVLTLRTPTVDDAELLLGFPKIIGAETDYLLCDENGIAGLTLERERRYIEMTLGMEHTAMFLGLIDGEMASLCDVRAESRPRLCHNASLSIAVRRDFWHIGVGSVLMREMIGFARDTGALKNLTLDVRADNARAIALYERFGFRIAGRHEKRICVRGEYFDELIMDLAL